MPSDTIAFNIVFLQRNCYFVSSVSPCQFRKGELRLEAMTEPNFGGSHKKVQNRSASSIKWETFVNSKMCKIIVVSNT